MGFSRVLVQDQNSHEEFFEYDERLLLDEISMSRFFTVIFEIYLLISDENILDSEVPYFAQE